jgi:hypothetical protein
MSRENVELVKALLPPPGTDLAPLARNEDAFARWRETFGKFVTEDYQSVTVWPGETTTYTGLEGARQLWLDWLEPWATYRTTTTRCSTPGNRVIVLLRDHGRRKDMDAEVELIGAALLTITDGR